MQPTATVSVADVLLLYAIPLALAAGAWLAISVWVWLLTRVSSRSALRADLERRVAARGRTRSGKGARLSFGYVARSLLADNSVQATFLYRVSRWLTIRRLRTLSAGVHAVSKLVTHADLSPARRSALGSTCTTGWVQSSGKAQSSDRTRSSARTSPPVEGRPSGTTWCSGQGPR